MKFSILAVLAAMVALTAAAPHGGNNDDSASDAAGGIDASDAAGGEDDAGGSNSVREQFKEESCQAQACIDAVDSGCSLNNINFVLGCDEDGNVG